MKLWTMQWIIEDIKASNLAELRVGGCEGKGRGVLVWKFLGSTLSPAPPSKVSENLMRRCVHRYLVFFCPFDLFTKIFMQKPFWVSTNVVNDNM